MADTPARDGFFQPAEWVRHRRTWMCWPCRAEAWGGGLAKAKAATAAVARAIARYEPVVMAARPKDADEAFDACAGFLPPLAERQRGEMSQRGVGGADPGCDRGGIFKVPLDDSWARDIGPTFLKGPGRAAVCWQFNAWGGKYVPCDQDALFAARVAEREGILSCQAPLVCEGGAIHVDGEGTLLTTEQCLLNPNRNPGLSRDAVEKILCDFTGARRVVWLGSDFSDDETDGHVDNIACFAAPGKVIAGVPDSRAHPDHAPAMEAIRRLKAAGLEMVELRQPKIPRQDGRGRLLQASYVNFYLCNDGLVMPSFDDPHDEAARATLADCFPDRDITVVPALDIVAGGGGIHCITQQEPE